MMSMMPLAYFDLLANLHTWHLDVRPSVAELRMSFSLPHIVAHATALKGVAPPVATHTT